MPVGTFPPQYNPFLTPILHSLILFVSTTNPPRTNCTNGSSLNSLECKLSINKLRSMVDWFIIVEDSGILRSFGDLKDERKKIQKIKKT